MDRQTINMKIHKEIPWMVLEATRACALIVLCLLYMPTMTARMYLRLENAVISARIRPPTLRTVSTLFTILLMLALPVSYASAITLCEQAGVSDSFLRGEGRIIYCSGCSISKPLPESPEGEFGYAMYVQLPPNGREREIVLKQTAESLGKVRIKRIISYQEGAEEGYLFDREKGQLTISQSGGYLLLADTDSLLNFTTDNKDIPLLGFGSEPVKDPQGKVLPINQCELLHEIVHNNIEMVTGEAMWGMDPIGAQLDLADALNNLSIAYKNALARQMLGMSSEERISEAKLLVIAAKESGATSEEITGQISEVCMGDSECIKEATDFYTEDVLPASPDELAGIKNKLVTGYTPRMEVLAEGGGGLPVLTREIITEMSMYSLDSEADQALYKEEIYKGLIDDKLLENALTDPKEVSFVKVNTLPGGNWFDKYKVFTVEVTLKSGTVLKFVSGVSLFKDGVGCMTLVNTWKLRGLNNPSL